MEYNKSFASSVMIASIRLEELNFIASELNAKTALHLERRLINDFYIVVLTIASSLPSVFENFILQESVMWSGNI